jgi:hypothetical protein
MAKDDGRQRVVLPDELFFRLHQQELTGLQ